MMDRVNVFQGVEWTSRVSFGGIKKYPFSFAALVVPSSFLPCFHLWPCFSGQTQSIQHLPEYTTHDETPIRNILQVYALDYWLLCWAGLPVCMFCALCGAATIINVRVGFWHKTGLICLFILIICLPKINYFRPRLYRSLWSGRPAANPVQWRRRRRPLRDTLLGLARVRNDIPFLFAFIRRHSVNAVVGFRDDPKRIRPTFGGRHVGTKHQPAILHNCKAFRWKEGTEKL